MITKEIFCRPFQGASSSYSRFLLIGVTANQVIDVLNTYKDIKPETVIDGVEAEEFGVKTVRFTIFSDSPYRIYHLTKDLKCKGYADTSWDYVCTFCVDNGEDTDDYVADWDTFETREDEPGYFDAFVKITDPSGVTFDTGAGCVDTEVVNKYTKMITGHSINRIKRFKNLLDTSSAVKGAPDSYKVQQIEKLIAAEQSDEYFLAKLSGDIESSGAKAINVSEEALKVLKAFYEGKKITIEEGDANA